MAPQSHSESRNREISRLRRERRQLLIENRRLRTEAERLAARAAAIQESQRRQIARELHDGPAHDLAALVMHLDFIIQAFTSRSEPAANVQAGKSLDPSLIEELRSVQQQATRVSRGIRDMLFDLRPLVLESGGLFAALEVLVARANSIGYLTAKLSLSGDEPPITPDTAAGVFAVVREAIRNVQKHAHALHLEVRAVSTDKDLTVVVRDDGRGFDVEAITSTYEERLSYGLLNMRERMEALGGRLTITSKAGAGTTVTIEVPIEPRPTRVARRVVS